MSGLRQSRRARVNVEAIVETTDGAAVIEAALASLERGEFTVDGEREALQAEIEGDAVAAVRWLVDPFNLLPEVPGAHVRCAEDTTVEIDEAGLECSAGPDFVALFPACRCGGDSCDECDGYQFTARTAICCGRWRRCWLTRGTAMWCGTGTRR